MISGYSGTPLAKKLGIRAGSRLFLLGAPENYQALVAPLPAGVQAAVRLDAQTDIVHAFATQRAALGKILGSARRAMRDDAVIWVSWPKRASGVPTDITEDVVRELALPLDLVDIKVCAVDDTWSGLKLVIRKTRRDAPTAGRPARTRPPRRPRTP